MAADDSIKRNSNVKLLEELEALSKSLYQSHTSDTTRRTASLALLRASPPLVSSAEDDTAKVTKKQTNKSRSASMSLSPWRSRPKPEDAKEPRTQPATKKFDDTANSSDKRGIWSWKPMRALSHIGMHKLSCLFSVEVFTAQGLPSSMNGLRLSVCVRKKETKDGSVQTMPSRVDQGAADFEETLFIRCHIYCNHGSGKQLKFEPRPFGIHLVAVDAKDLSFGTNCVDLSQLIQESVEKSQQGIRVRQWDTSLGLSGKAKGGELVLKLGFQIIGKEGGVQIYNQEENVKSKRFKNLTSPFARKQSKSSFSLPSSRITNKSDAWTPSQRSLAEDIQGIDNLNLDDPQLVYDSPPSVPKLAGGEEKVEDFDLPDFEVVDKGVEVQEKKECDGEGSEKSIKVKSVTSEVVKEILHDQLRLTQLTELDSIAKQIKALECMMGEDTNKSTKGEDTESLRLDSDEEIVTREFLHMLEDQKARSFKNNQSEIPSLQVADAESKVYLPDLGKGLGCVVQTRDGGYLTSMNPLDNVVARNETPKLAMQMSKSYVLASNQSSNGLELFQKLAGIGLDELSSQVFSVMPLDELIGKTAEQIAFEGIASAIIQGRNKEGASSSAARIISALKGMANAMSSGRQERISSGLWNADETPVTAEKILAFAMQKIEFMAVEGLKIQAGMAEEEAPLDVSPLITEEGNKEKDPLGSAVSLEDWITDQSYSNGAASSDSAPSNITLIFVVQLRDPMRRFEAVGGPVMVLIDATSEENTNGSDYDQDDDETRFKVTSMHVGGLKVRSTPKNAWDSEKQRLTAMQWLIEYGLGKAGKKGKLALVKGPDSLWSISSRIVADMWLQTVRNPDVKIVRE